VHCPLYINMYGICVEQEAKATNKTTKTKTVFIFDSKQVCKRKNP
jgi:hypothetical protein